MHSALELHPNSRCTTVTRVDVDVTRPRPGELSLFYRATGKIGDLRMPPPTAATRSDGLWRRTCFEAFVQAVPGTGYYEFNFAPSTQWAAYGFDDYRNGMAVVHEMNPPRLEVGRDAQSFGLQVSMKLDRLARLPGDAPWRLGLSAVIEETGGRRSYWALAHPPGKADFHHSDCFALELPPTSRP